MWEYFYLYVYKGVVIFLQLFDVWIFDGYVLYVLLKDMLYQEIQFFVNDVLKMDFIFKELFYYKWGGILKFN